jgi:uncharacterized membrane protein
MRSLKDDIEFAERLDKETGFWQQEGLITPEQRKSILLRYSRLKEVGERAGPGRLVSTVSVLGSILVGIGVILFIAANWSEIPRWGKLSIIFVSMLSSYGAGYYLRYESGTYPKVGASLILLGSLIFGAGIFLIAQIFHVTAHYPNGPLMWGLGVLPMAYLMRLRSLLFLAIADILLWVGLESSFRLPGPGGYYFLEFTVLYLMCGLALWGAGLMHRGIERLKTISAPYIVTGMFITFVAGYLLTFDIHISMFGPGSRSLFPFYVGITIIFMASAVVRLVLSESDRWRIWEITSLFVLFVLALSYALFTKTQFPETETALYASDMVVVLTANLIFAAAVVGTIVLGYMRRQPFYVNVGLLFFALDVIARYFDFFWELLPRSVFFMAGGLMLLSGGILLERKRRKILASFEEVHR